MTMMRDSHLATYVPRVVDGDGAARHALIAQLEPLLIQLLRRSRTLGPMRHNLDDCRAVMTSFDGLAAPRDAEQVVRAALARLRRQFGDQVDG